MELIEGASLQEHFTSLKEKKEKGMGEARLWKVSIQVRSFFSSGVCDKYSYDVAMFSFQAGK